ncbi:integrase, catalytic region, zinc finger, CCHC-type containing protein [Tanacetum coccineum]
MTESPFVDSCFVVHVFSPGDDPIACLNKAMAFLTAVASLRFPSTNNQLRTSSNPRNQATIQDGRIQCNKSGKTRAKCILTLSQRLSHIEPLVSVALNVRTDNGTEFVNQTLREWYENVSIIHQTSVARTPQQNGVVKRRNRTLVEAARSMLIFLELHYFSGPKLSIYLVTPKIVL